jgi:hypothetical protein
MKTIKYFLLLFLLPSIIYSQSIVVGDGATIDVGSGADICASVWGNIAGNLTGTGTQCGSTLPVELVSFGVSVDSGSVELKWNTASETNNYGFFVERRRDDEQNFSEVEDGFIPGHGSTLEPQSYSFVDNTITELGTYYYRLRQVDNDGLINYSSPVRIIISVLSVAESIPLSYKLEQNYPNPFNPTTGIKYQVPKKEMVQLIIYDVLGKSVTTLVDEEKPAGTYEVKFDASFLSSGIYIYKLKAGVFMESKKLILLK